VNLHAKSRLVISLAALALLSPGRAAFADCAVIDDMESYNPFGMRQIYEIWIDGAGICQPGSGNDTGSTVEENYEIFFSGYVSMQYDYDNDGNAFNPCTLEQGPREHKWSVARAELADLASEITSDWTTIGVDVLSLAFYGEAGNDIEDMWIRLEDSTGGDKKIYYGDNPGEDPNDMTVESWHAWLIDLNRFTPEVDLTRIHAMSIGIGEEGSTADGGSGTIYFDDIGLCAPEYSTVYVNSAAGGDNTGLTWQDAFASLQDALDVLTVDQILVAEGIYYPSVEAGGAGDRYKTFQMRESVGIYGGFPSTGDPSFEDRDPTKYRTILSGDIGIPGDYSDNCYHVFYHWLVSLNSTAVLDGFTITGGNANGSSSYGHGGGMYNGWDWPILANCTFTGNIALYGGAIYNEDSMPTIINCTFSGNSAEYCAGIYNQDSDPPIVNCIIWGNLAADGSQIYDAGTGRRSAEVTYSHVEGGWPGVGNTQGDPLFVRNPSDGGDGWGVGGNDDLGDLRLRPGSPCIDAGDNGSLPPGADGLRKILDGDCNDIATVDMGAYEFDFTAFGDTAEDCDVDSNDFALLAARWQDSPCNQGNDYCDLADIDRQNGVDFRDVLILAENWLARTQ